jgi:hypothetical protein
VDSIAQVNININLVICRRVNANASPDVPKPLYQWGGCASPLIQSFGCTDSARALRLTGSAGALLTGSCKLKYRQSMLIISLSLARPGSAFSLSRITPNQFGMCYRKALPQEKERAQQRLGILSEVISLNIEIELILKMMRIYPALEERTL